MPVHEINHPLVKHKIGLLRNKDILVKDFRAIVAEIGVLLTYEATQDLSTKEVTIDTWAGQAEVQKVSNQDISVVPILRAGLGMLDGVLQMLPGAGVSVVGFARNEDTLEAENYYEKLVADIKDKTVIVIDPMLATGGTLDATLDLLKQAGCKKIKGIFLVAAPEGIARIEQKHPEVDIYVAAVDDHLNEQGYILPGLGDAGDKIFGTL
ncbi:uracil phosphoribosyltransferase [Marinicella sp. S1101]|uniref:uracil phosphoribosyltransferase n=1 Tax=Marinicella marina TaxID=2996016 RepID=UPI002260CAA7|nr:uracil phosphoribosyltransferase [Marinicella marina]MCX7553336.1 uracil phosphoribosyltransferase [Marinicella marina]MDJ1139068.1 uracil phosphoribosyltransferase [Marinicella marina]